MSAAINLNQFTWRHGNYIAADGYWGWVPGIFVFARGRKTSILVFGVSFGGGVVLVGWVGLFC